MELLIKIWKNLPSIVIKPFTVKGKLSLWTCEHEIEYLKKPKNEKEDEAFGRRCWNPIIYNV